MTAVKSAGKKVAPMAATMVALKAVASAESWVAMKAVSLAARSAASSVAK